jgi:hypothetical protein
MLAWHFISFANQCRLLSGLQHIFHPRLIALFYSNNANHQTEEVCAPFFIRYMIGSAEAIFMASISRGV